ncbi:MAG TPA: HAD-IA family hydrolase [Bryobacteraceae bacterium]|nr:HAD-IA family hydrolase [Bryobacteraceae bacterium]
MSQPILVFDMDGVLVDATESYRETIARTVRYFAGVEISRGEIQDYKNQGGWNDDWKLSHHLIETAGIDVAFEAVKAHFQEVFFGNGTDGLVLREKWLARPGVMEKLNRRFRFAIFTGRPREDADFTLRRFARNLVFDPIVAMHDVEHQKPAPDGLLQITRANGSSQVFYLGDTVDDARAARTAGVPFIGIAAPSNPRHGDLVRLFQAEGAPAIIDDINHLDEVLAS